MSTADDIAKKRAWRKHFEHSGGANHRSDQAGFRCELIGTARRPLEVPHVGYDEETTCPDAIQEKKPARPGNFASALSLRNPRGLPNILAWCVLIAFMCTGLYSCFAMPERKRQAAEPVLTALATYKREKGRYPETLDELVPRYLQSIPEDFGKFSTTPGVISYHRFKPEGKTPDTYGLVFFVFAFTRCSYDPRTGTWSTWD